MRVSNQGIFIHYDKDDLVSLKTYSAGGMVNVQFHDAEGEKFHFWVDYPILSVLQTAIAEYLTENRPCELCDLPATTTESDELGNDCSVCEDHAQMLASRKPERAADVAYDSQKDL